MKNIKKKIQNIKLLLALVFTVVSITIFAFAMADTSTAGSTLGTNISTTGTLTVGSSSQFDGTIANSVTSTDTASGTVRKNQFTTVHNPATIPSSALVGYTFEADTGSGNSQPFVDLYSLQPILKHQGTATMNTALTVDASLQNTSSGNITTAIGVGSQITNSGSGTITNAIALQARSASVSSGTVTNNIGLDIQNFNSQGTNQYPILFRGTGSANAIVWGTDANNIRMYRASNDALALDDLLRFNAAGITISADKYEMGRDADGELNQLHFNTPSGATMEFSANDVAWMVGGASGVTITQAAQSSGSSKALSVTGGASTLQTASTETIDANFNFSNTLQHATGDYALQRVFNILARTYSFVAASTITSAATLYVDRAPQAGTNATITNPYAFWVDAGSSRFDGRILGAKGSDVASGTTLTLGDGNYFQITGTTTVNHITTTGWTAGSVIVLHFTGSLTVNHNAGSPPASTSAILLSGAGNFSATADDTLTLIYDGTTFREMARSVI